jgi:uncharacterized protein with beta-barrel porin domain
MSGVGDFGGVNGNANANGYQLHSGGFLLGGDDKVLERLNIGATAGYINAGGTRNIASGSLSSNMWQLGAYADISLGDNEQGHVGALLGYTQGLVKISNPSTLGTSSGQSNAHIVTGEVRGSWNWDLGNGHSLTPVGSIQAMYNQLGSLGENGLGALSLNVPTQNATFVSARQQLRYDYNWKSADGVKWTASASAGVRELITQPNANLNLSYSGIQNQNFTVQGVELNTTAGLVNAGITTHVNENLNVEVGYRGTYSGNTTINAFQGNVVWKF